MASKRKVRKRVAAALRKYVRGNAGRSSFRKSKKRFKKAHGSGLGPSGRVHKEAYKAHLKTLRRNPRHVKGRKTKGGRAVTLRNFTGTIVKKSDGTVQIVGRGRRK